MAPRAKSGKQKSAVYAKLRRAKEVGGQRAKQSADYADDKEWVSGKKEIQSRLGLIRIYDGFNRCFYLALN